MYLLTNECTLFQSELIRRKTKTYKIRWTKPLPGVLKNSLAYSSSVKYCLSGRRSSIEASIFLFRFSSSILFILNILTISSSGSVSVAKTQTSWRILIWFFILLYFLSEHAQNQSSYLKWVMQYMTLIFTFRKSKN